MFGFFSILFIIMGFGNTIPASAWLIASVLAFFGLSNIGYYVNKRDRLPDRSFGSLLTATIIINILFPVFSLPWAIWGIVIALGLIGISGQVINGVR